ncbi:MAG: DEAD/DEAH box helicase family protein [Prevotella sp.]|nr:DEAD/DEAH box helicase family protein [Prevotella sp.]
MEQFKQFNNITTRVIDDLKATLLRGSRVSMAAASFSIYAFEALQKELSQVSELRFIFTSPTFNKEQAKKQKREFYIPKLHRERTLYGSDFEIKLRNNLTQRAIAKECAEWIRRKVRFKTNVSQMNMPGFLNVENPRGRSAADVDQRELYTYMPFNEFTTTELGCERGNNIFQLIQRMPTPISDAYLENFNDFWNDKENFADVTEAVIENIENAYRENAPDFIYFVTLYNIFNEFLEDISEDVLPNEATGFKSSQIWNKLYHFQKDAALAIINKLETYNGCILADSVGLGKTFTALSVIKYYEGRNKSVLVLCPKKLYDNWNTYKSNYKNNPLEKDRLRYDVLFHTDLSRGQGKSNGIDLALLNWGNYDLIVIDESHNFRNGGKVTTDEDDANPRENRYLRLMNKVIRAGVKTKVLMLSATPVNNRFNDLKNQLQLAYEGEQALINDKLDVDRPIEDIFRSAQAQYNAWAHINDPKERTTERLLEMLSFDFFQVLDAVTIARSRKHIEKYYDTNDIGRFPTRLRPISKRPHLTDLDEAITYKEISGQLDDLNLGVYAPSDYILPSKRCKYEIDKDGEGTYLGMSGREKGLKKLMAINLLKRLESSVNSFRLTLQRMKEQIDETLRAIETFLATRQDARISIQTMDNMLDGDDSENDFLVGGRKTRVSLADMDCRSWQRDLKADQETIGLLLVMLRDITPEHDSKLQMLMENLREKFAQPLNGNNKKVLVFTAFSDTAEYLYDNLAQTILKKTGLHTGLVTGNGVSTTIKGLRSDFNSILTLFSPISKEADKLLPDVRERIDVLIATDCISEGQNLQDCDYLINYDIHWNPVRIIQRFGRVDRIGSRNEVIQLVNYWPDMELDDYLRLKGRVEARMTGVNITGAGNSNVLLSDEEQADLDYRKSQLQRLQEEVVDLEDMDTGINIMDLGLNEFRLDLLAFMKDHPDIEHTPYGMSAVVPATSQVEPGVIFILKNRNKEVNIGRKNLLHPFYMVYLSQTGGTVVSHLSPKRLLDTMRLLCKGKVSPYVRLCQQFNRETDDGKRMDEYSLLLRRAVESIVEQKEEDDLESLFMAAETTALVGNIKGLDDFELICFLVIKEEVANG